MQHGSGRDAGEHFERRPAGHVAVPNPRDGAAQLLGDPGQELGAAGDHALRTVVLHQVTDEVEPAGPVEQGDPGGAASPADDQMGSSPVEGPQVASGSTPVA